MNHPTPIWAGAVEGLMGDMKGVAQETRPAGNRRRLDAVDQGRDQRKRDRGALGTLERELHDTVLQDLLCMSMGLNELVQSTEDDTSRATAHQLQQVASRAYEQLRELIAGRSSEKGVPRGMPEVLTECVQAFNRKTGAEVQLQMHDSERPLAVSGEVARQADLIVHEALCNAWHHAKAQTIKVVLSETADIIWVRVLDDGRGFDSTVRTSGHFGLRIMQERADAIGARLGVSSAPGRGTCVNLYLPCHHSTRAIMQPHSGLRR